MRFNLWIYLSPANDRNKINYAERETPTESRNSNKIKYRITRDLVHVHIFVLARDSGTQPWAATKHHIPNALVLQRTLLYQHQHTQSS